MEVGVVFQLAIREICFREIDLKSQFVKYECLENNRLYGISNGSRKRSTSAAQERTV